MTDEEMAVKYVREHTGFNVKEPLGKIAVRTYLAGYEAGKPRGHNIKKDGQPPKAGLYLCYRRWHYTDMYELIYWTGEYWVTGSTDYDVIFAWYEIPKFEENK